MKLVRLLLLVSAAIAASPLCFAEANAADSEYIKNGMLCVKEICLGDGINELRKIKWDKAKKASASEIKQYKANMERRYRGNLIASTPYIVEREWSPVGEFDNQALSNLDQVIAICKQHQYLTGRFTTPSGNPTTVNILLIPTEDNQKQKWTVISIARGFPNAITDKQQEEVRAQLDERYGAFKLNEETGQVRKNGDMRYVGGGRGFKLETLWPNLNERLYLHPSCGGATKINIE